MAMQAQLPFLFKPLVDLVQAGIPKEFVNFNTLTLNEKFICVREQSQSPSVSIIEILNPSNVEKRQIKAESTIMNPIDRIIGLKLGNSLQVYKLAQTPVNVARCNMNDPVEFWKWISPTVIGIVTNRAVFHWDIQKGDPVQVFARISNLNNHRIMNYQVNSDFTWMALVGIAQENNRFVGHMQLHSSEKNISQPLDAHAVTFTKTPTGSTILAFISRNTAEAKLVVGDVLGGGAYRIATTVPFHPDSPNDFPIAIEISERFKIIYIITKEGMFYMYDMKYGKRITSNKISQDMIFAATVHSGSGGLLAINNSGIVMALTVNEGTIVSYIISALNDIPLAISVAGAANLPVPENLVQTQFQQLFHQGLYQDAAKFAAESPGGVLRNGSTINLFKNLPIAPGQTSPLFNYFVCLLDRGSLNDLETMELVRPVVAQGRNKELIEKWLAADQLFCSEALGDLLRPLDRALSLRVYEKAGCKSKVVQCYAENGQYDELVKYCKTEGFQPNWMMLLQAIIAVNPPAAANFAKMLLTAEGGRLMDPNAVIDAFMARQLVKETTSVMLDILSANRPEDGPLQTRLLEINLKYAAVVAEAIFENKMFTHYDYNRICQASHAAGLIHRALQHTTDINEAKRLLVTARNLTPNVLIGFFHNKSASQTIECLRELLRTNLNNNLDLVIAVGVKFTPLPTAVTDPAEILSVEKMIALFEEFHCFHGTFHYLKQIIALHKSNTFAVFKFIEAAASLQPPEMQAIEMAVREYEYEPEKVRDFLREQRLPDQLPLVLVCDKFNFIPELTSYLYKNNMMQFILAYVQSINPLNTPLVVGSLIDLACDDDKIQHILTTVDHLCPVDTLVEEVEKRNKLKMLRGWLDARIAEGNKESATHDARAKIFILTNDERKEQFLVQNECYNSLVVGKFCESHDAYLAYVAYKRGKCHDQLIDVTNRHSLFKYQAKYLVEEQDTDLWAKVLSPSNEYRRQVIDEVVQTALPETKRADMVSSTVKAFMEADLPKELIVLLEKIVLQGTEEEFSKNRNLQNLLLLTAIKADKDRVMEYIDQLTGFDAPEIAEIAIESYLFEEAFVIYKKFKLNVKAIQVLVKFIKNLDRAVDFADACTSAPDSKEVYSTLGVAQLDENQVVEAIDSFMKAEDHNHFERVVESAKKVGALDPLSKFLKMCRKKARSDRIDSELLYTLAKLNKNAEIDEFIRNPHVARIQDVGEICFKEKLYEAAKILFSHINHYPKLASTFVKLQQFSNAIDAARKASSVVTWKEINRACVDAGDFRYDKIAGINVIIHPDELEETCSYYEKRGYTAELMALLESGLGLESTSNRKELFTELAIVYSKYKPSKLMEHLKFWRKNLNIPKVCQVCRNNRQWAEVVFLYEIEPDYEKAARIMIDHSPEAWDEGRFPQIISKVTHMELLYDSIKFYLEQHPDQINELLSSITARVDPGKVVERVGKLSHLPLIKRYLVSVQERNIPQVNEALNDMYIEEEDYDSLRLSIDTYDSFDSIALARKLSQHDLIEFKRISAKLFRQNKRWKQSIDISKADKMYKDAMETAALSGEQEIAEGLLEYFVLQDLKHCYSACLYACYELIRPDFALELAWKHKIIDSAFPFILQVLREYTSKVDHLTKLVKQEKPEHQQTPIGVPAGVHIIPPGVGLPPGAAVLPPGQYPGGIIPGVGLPPGAAVIPPGMAVLPPGTMLPPGYPHGVIPPGTMTPPPGVGLPPGTVAISPPPGQYPPGNVIAWRQ